MFHDFLIGASSEEYEEVMKRTSQLVQEREKNRQVDQVLTLYDPLIDLEWIGFIRDRCIHNSFAMLNPYPICEVTACTNKTT